MTDQQVPRQLKGKALGVLTWELSGGGGACLWGGRRGKEQASVSVPGPELGYLEGDKQGLNTGEVGPAARLREKGWS